MGRQLTPDEEAERERRRVEARAEKEGRLHRKRVEQELGSAVRVDAQVVRLTPDQEAQRRKDLAVRMAARDERLRLQKLQLVKSAAEELGDEKTAEEATRLISRAELKQQMEGGIMKILNTRLVLSYNWLAKKGMEFLRRMADILPYGIVRRIGLRHGFAAALVFGGGLSYTLCNPDGSVRATGLMEINGITTVGLNHILDTEFHATAQVTTWAMGLINGGSAPTLAAADTMGSHAGWTEYTAYDETNRVTWDEGAASAGSVTNATTMDFSMNATGTVAGGFLTSSSTKGGTTGVLFMTATFSGGNQAVGSGDTLKLTYTLNTTAS